MAIITSGAFPIDPYVDTGLVLTDKLNQLFAAIESNNLNATRPDYVTNGGTWAKDNGNGTATLMLFSNGLDIAVASSSDLSDKAPINSPAFTGNPTITTNNTSPALKITQTGTGNALVVEDSASPDSSPFVIDASGRVLVGVTATQIVTTTTPSYQQYGNSLSSSGMALGIYGASAAGATFSFLKTRGTNIGDFSPVIAGDLIGQIVAVVDDGTDYGSVGASIRMLAESTYTVNNCPSYLTFNTNGGASGAGERMRIDSAGNVTVTAAQGTAANSLTRKDYVDSVAGGGGGATGGGLDKVFVNTDTLVTANYLLGQEAITAVVTANVSNLLTSTAHGFIADQLVQFATTGTLPAPLAVATGYYVISSGLTANDFKVSATLGGTEIDITTTGTGVHKVGKLKNSSTAGTIAIATGFTVTVPTNANWVITG